MGLPGRKRRLVVGLTIAASLGFAAAGSSQFTSSLTDPARALLEGNWQSCREIGGIYSERIYDNDLPGIGPFEVHLGPYHDFALFRGVQDEHRSHDDAANLLRPYTVEVRANRARQTWSVEGLSLDVALAGGGRPDCESWFVVLKRSGPGSSD